VSTKDRYTRAQIKAEIERFDWSAVDAMTDKQIEEAVRTDPDAVLLTDSDLAKADLVIPAKARHRRKRATG
jgi:hypothetical protein